MRVVEERVGRLVPLAGRRSAGTGRLGLHRSRGRPASDDLPVGGRAGSRALGRQAFRSGGHSRSPCCGRPARSPARDPGRDRPAGAGRAGEDVDPDGPRVVRGSGSSGCWQVLRTTSAFSSSRSSTRSPARELPGTKESRPASSAVTLLKRLTLGTRSLGPRPHLASSIRKQSRAFRWNSFRAPGTSPDRTSARPAPASEAPQTVSCQPTRVGGDRGRIRPMSECRQYGCRSRKCAGP